jgi:hypothetical protein
LRRIRSGVIDAAGVVSRRIGVRPA